MARRRKGRAVSGVLLLDKPAGMTSNGALQKVRWLFQAQKAGHTGSLDPLATGLLPICLGEATKFSRFLLEADKGYQVTARFGLLTDTLDTDGETLETADASALAQSQIEKMLSRFRGEIQQVPPIYSALKRDGKPLYQYAREGKEVEIEARPVTIHKLDLLAFQAGPLVEAEFRVQCSKGTYIRSLVRDIGEALGVPATVSALRRTETGGFTLDQTCTVGQMEDLRESEGAESLDQLLLPTEILMQHHGEVVIDAASAHFFMQGQAVMVNQVYRFGAEGDIVRVRCEQRGFLGAATITDDGKIQPKRLVV